MMPSFKPITVVDPVAMDDSSKLSATVSQDDASRHSAGDKSDSGSSSPSEDSGDDSHSAVPRVKDKKEAAEIFKQLLKDKVNPLTIICHVVLL